MSTPAEEIADCRAEIARAVRIADRLHADQSASVRALARARMAGECVSAVETATYPLAWLLTTGRASAQLVAALVAMRPAEFARLVVRIHEAHPRDGVAAIAAAWTRGATSDALCP